MLNNCALYDNNSTVTIKYFYKAICNTKSVYPDVLTKEKERFKEVFGDLITAEQVSLEETL